MNEAEFDAEFDRLVQEHEACPVCDGAPVELGCIVNEEDGDVWLYAVCEAGHLYHVERTEADDY